MTANLTLYPWFRFFQSLIFWQAIWFLYFQNTLSAAEAILLYAIYDIGTTVMEIPSGYMSDRIGRRFTLIASAIAGCLSCILLATGDSFAVFSIAQVLLGASSAFASGTDSALLFESLAAEDRDAEIEAQELTAWRFSFAGFAVSAVAGGAMALVSATLPFVATAIAFAILILIASRFVEPPKAQATQSSERMRLKSLGTALSEPVLIWLFALGVLMYVFSHIPFVFGQPFILESLQTAGLDGEAPLVSGAVTSIMMIISVITSLFALRLRNRIGLPAILLLAFSIQIGLTAVLALTTEAIAILFLFLRMVPDSLSRPFILGRIQPLLSDNSRATYLSIRSFCARLLFAASLYMASKMASDSGNLVHNEIKTILGWYTIFGIVCLVALFVTARRVEPKIMTEHN